MATSHFRRRRRLNGEPACLEASKHWRKRSRRNWPQGGAEDRFLGRLHQKGVKVHERAVRELRATETIRSAQEPLTTLSEKEQVLNRHHQFRISCLRTQHKTSLALCPPSTGITARTRLQWNRSHSRRSQASATICGEQDFKSGARSSFGWMLASYGKSNSFSAKAVYWILGGKRSLTKIKAVQFSIC